MTQNLRKASLVAAGVLTMACGVKDATQEHKDPADPPYPMPKSKGLDLVAPVGGRLDSLLELVNTGPSQYPGYQNQTLRIQQMGTGVQASMSTLGVLTATSWDLDGNGTGDTIVVMQQPVFSQDLKTLVATPTYLKWSTGALSDLTNHFVTLVDYVPGVHYDVHSWKIGVSGGADHELVVARDKDTVVLTYDRAAATFKIAATLPFPIDAGSFACDINGDGIDDLISYDGNGHLGYYEAVGNSFKPKVAWQTPSTGVQWDFFCGKFKDDQGRHQVAGLAHGANTLWLSSYGDPWQRFWQALSTGVTWRPGVAGDLNGTGLDKLYLLAKETGGLFSSTWGSAHQDYFNTWAADAEWTNAMMVDCEGDGKPEIFARYPNGYGWCDSGAGFGGQQLFGFVGTGLMQADVVE